MTLHFGVYNSITGKFGRIEGPANGKTVKVHWVDDKKTVETVSIGRHIRKVLEGSIEYKALVEPQTCAWLLREDPAEFFSILLNYRVYEDVAPLDEKKILGEKSPAAGSKARNKKSLGISLREGIKDAKSKELFDDYDAFEAGWLKACEIWSRQEDPPVIVPRKGHKRSGIRPNLQPNIEMLSGSIAASNQITLLEVIESDLGQIRDMFNELKPESSFEKLLKSAFTENYSPKFDKDFWLELIREQSTINVTYSSEWLKSCLSMASSVAGADSLSALLTFALARAFELDQSQLSSRQIITGIADQAKILSTIENDPLADVWLATICSKLDALGFSPEVETDSSLIFGFLAVSQPKSFNRDSLLADYANWLQTDSPWSQGSMASIKSQLKRILSSLEGEYTPVRITLLQVALSQGFNIDNSKFFRPLDVQIICGNAKLRQLLLDASLAEKITKPVFVSFFESSALPELDLLSAILTAGNPLIAAIRDWGLSHEFNSKFWNVVGSSDEPVYELLNPFKLEQDLRATSDSFKLEVHRNNDLTKKVLDLEAKTKVLEAEISALSERLREAQMTNNDLLANRITSSLLTTSSAFASAARAVRLDGGVLPAAQINLTIEQRLNDAGIRPAQEKGEVLGFNPSTMKLVDGEAREGQQVEIVDPAYELAILGKNTLLTQALVRCIMET